MEMSTEMTTTLAPTPGQTVGPFFGYALPFDKGHELVPSGTAGAVRLHGTITDGEGKAIPDAMFELWQADANGDIVNQPGSLLREDVFTGWGRVETNREGGYWFRTVEPGAKDGKAPFFLLTIFARGLMNRLFTRIYLPENEAALAADPLLSSLPEDRRKTLIASREADGSLRFDVRLHVEDETVFLTYDSAEFAGKDGVGA